MPKNDIADSCLRELRKYGVGTSHVVYGGDRLGIYFLETGAVARPSKVVYDRAHSSVSEIAPGMVDWEKALQDASWFHWTGITPAISQGAADACLEAIRTANRLGIPVSTDLNYRKNLWKYGKTAAEVMPALVEGCDLILGNEEDAEKVVRASNLKASMPHRPAGASTARVSNRSAASSRRVFRGPNAWSLRCAAR